VLFQLFTVKPRSTDTRLIRTLAYNGQFCLSRRKAHIFSVKLTRFIRTPINKDNGHFSVSRVTGCLPFRQEIRKFRFEVKWKGNFPENLFGNCGQPPEVVHFFRSERNLGNALTICQNRPVSRPFLVFSRQIE